MESCEQLWIFHPHLAPTSSLRFWLFFWEILDGPRNSMPFDSHLRTVGFFSMKSISHNSITCAEPHIASAWLLNNIRWTFSEIGVHCICSQSHSFWLLLSKKLISLAYIYIFTYTWICAGYTPIKRPKGEEVSWCKISYFPWALRATGISAINNGTSFGIGYLLPGSNQTCSLTV